MKEARRIAYCGMMAALAVVIMVIGSIAGLGMYASPMFSGLCLIPVGRSMGRKYHVLLWLVVSLLCFMLVPGVEQNLMFFTLFGCYPILHPLFHRLGKLPRIICKLLFFNAVTVAVEMLVMLVLVPESMSAGLAVTLMLLGNLTFICYDFLVPRAEFMLNRLLRRTRPPRN